MPKPSIVGTWVSEGVEERPGHDGNPLYVLREFTNTPDRFTAKLNFFSDPEAKQPTLGVEIEGPYEIWTPSPDVEGAYKANIHFGSLKVAPRNDYFLGAFKETMDTGTPWELGSFQDVSDLGGCPPIGLDLVDHGTEYELIKLEGDKLHYGARPADGTSPNVPEKRATSLQVPLVRA